LPSAPRVEPGAMNRDVRRYGSEKLDNAAAPAELGSVKPDVKVLPGSPLSHRTRRAVDFVRAGGPN
jgi:hypothetical protein